MGLRTFIVALILATTVSLGASAFAQEKPSLPTNEFIRKASVGNQFEIESGRLALSRTATPEIRYFAQTMVTGHTQIDMQLKAILASSDIGTVPAKELDVEHKATLDRLKSALEQDFDGEYIQSQIDSHEYAILLFKDYAENGDNDDLKKFASDTLSTLIQHREKLHDLTPANANAGL